MTFPEWLVPMAATLTHERFSGPEWNFERKLDGIRLLAFRRGGEVRLFSRNRLPQDYPPLARAIADLPARELIARRRGHRGMGTAGRGRVSRVRPALAGRP